MQTVGYIDIEKYRCITDDIVTDEVIITDTQIRHIMERHPGDYERFYGYLPEIIADPDFILGGNKPNTAFILKTVTCEGEDFQLILRLKTSHDPDDYLNSVITFLKIDRKKRDKYLRNKKVLYKRE